MRSVGCFNEVQIENTLLQCEVPMPSEFAQHIDPPTTPKKPPVSVSVPIPERLLDSDEAASIMNVHPKTLQKLARKGIVRGVHVGKLWRFRASTIEEWIQRQLAS
jgi:excisionase family DNA binding protein